MANSLLTILPEPGDLLALEPEELGAILIEVIPGISQHAGFVFSTLSTQVFPVQGGGGYQRNFQEAVDLALAEALSWLVTQGLVVRTPNQPADWHQLTRRGRSMKSRVDVEAYRLGRELPVELLQTALVEKVHHLFLRGDHETAVFQAFKMVETYVRKAGGYGEAKIGVDLMREAFHPDTGPLREKERVKPEREATMHLFAAAIGHAKNPPSHRDVQMDRQTAARLIVFASHLLDIADRREITHLIG